MIKNKMPKNLSVEMIKQKARTSASVLSSLVLSGHRSLNFEADIDLVLHFIGVHLLARSLHKEIIEAKKVIPNFDPQAIVSATKWEIINEIKYLQSKNNMN